MKRTRRLVPLTPADGIAALPNEPLEKIEAMIAAGKCPKPVFIGALSEMPRHDAENEEPEEVAACLGSGENRNA